MSESALKRMATLVLSHAPLARPTAEDWIRCEENLGVPLPSDFKELVTLIGWGRFGGELWFANPLLKKSEMCLCKEQLCRFREDMSFWETELGIKFYPEPGGLIGIGGVGRMQFFLHSGVDAVESSWLVVDFDYLEIHPGRGRISEFILALYDGAMAEQWENRLRGLVWGNGRPFFWVFGVAPNGRL
jgi:hypothetical protein